MCRIFPLSLITFVFSVYYRLSLLLFPISILLRFPSICFHKVSFFNFLCFSRVCGLLFLFLEVVGINVSQEFVEGTVVLYICIDFCRGSS